MSKTCTFSTSAPEPTEQNKPLMDTKYPNNYVKYADVNHVVVRETSKSINHSKTHTRTRTRTDTLKHMGRHRSAPSQTYSIYSHLSQFFDMGDSSSVYGPTRSPQERIKFMFIIILMTVFGVNNDFLSRFNYLALPPFTDIYWIIWFSWLLTTGCDAICTFALIPGWKDGEEWAKAKKEWKKFWFNTWMTGTLGFLNDCGKYLAVIFLPASVVSLMKNGLQMVFSAMFRKVIERKTLSTTQWSGILTVTIGLICVCMASVRGENRTDNMDNIIGTSLLLSAAFCGSVRNHYEQILCRDMKFNANFVVGMREIPTFFWMIVTGICLYYLEPSSVRFFHFVFSYQAFVIGFILFMIAVYGKNVTQMKVIELSSALTRNLTLQFVPFGTWITSLVFYYFINEQYGERWEIWSWLQLGGFCLVGLGSWCYMKIPKAEGSEDSRLIETHTKGSEAELYTTGTVHTNQPTP